MRGLDSESSEPGMTSLPPRTTRNRSPRQRMVEPKKLPNQRAALTRSLRGSNGRDRRTLGSRVHAVVIQRAAAHRTAYAAAPVLHGSGNLQRVVPRSRRAAPLDVGSRDLGIRNSRAVSGADPAAKLRLGEHLVGRIDPGRLGRDEHGDVSARGFQDLDEIGRSPRRVRPEHHERTGSSSP